MENPIKMDDLGVPLFSETSILIYNHLYNEIIRRRFLVLNSEKHRQGTNFSLSCISANQLRNRMKGSATYHTLKLEPESNTLHSTQRKKQQISDVCAAPRWAGDSIRGRKRPSAKHRLKSNPKSRGMGLFHGISSIKVHEPTPSRWPCKILLWHVTGSC